jgi:hypothetical protein
MSTILTWNLSIHGRLTHMTKGYEKNQFRIAYGHGQRSEDHHQEKCISHFKSLGHGTQCKADLDHDAIF